ncbi:cytochrome P450 [Aspergillus karnatakaensis]|uniref:cytochrome P450 n=1 Tax=Aspergillus karnatakaensis TaxID=1810916 RepID=UPI003CCD4CA9
MLSSTLACTVLLSTLYIPCWIIYARFVHPLKDVPGPFLASVSRFWLAYQVTTDRIDIIQRVLHEKYGPLVRIAPDEVSVADPTSVKAIYRIKSGFTKTDFYTPWAANLTPHGDNFSERDKPKHNQRRRIVNSLYSMSSVLESEKYIDACTDVFLDKMKTFSKAKRAVDLGEWIQWYTFDVIGELFYGQQFGFMRNEHDFGHYIGSLDILMPGITVLCMLPEYLRLFQMTLNLVFPSMRDALQSYTDIRNAAKFWVERRMQSMKEKEACRVDLLEKLFQVRNARSDFDIPEIQVESLGGIFAGSDTTAIAIRAILYYLIRTPVTYDKLMMEIDATNRDGRLSRPHVKYSEAIKLPYLVACCKEGMHMHPSVGLSLPRHVPAGGKILAGRFFHPGAKDIFGKDAAVYNPDRWLRDAIAAAETDCHMLHFGGGSRTCIGKNIALAEIHKIIPDLLRSYRLELVDIGKEWTTRNFWFNKQTGIEVYVTMRESE